MRSAFGSGVRLRDHRELSREAAIENAHVPAVCTLPMQQDGGPSAECVVEVGDIVAEGSVVGRAVAPGSANVHTPVPGRVAAIREMNLPGHRTCQAVVVVLSGRFARSGKLVTPQDWRRMGGDRIVERLRAGGVVGLGGESVPLRMIWGDHRPTRTLVVNCVEAEPFLTASYRLLVERMGRIVTGICIVQKLLEPGRVVIGIAADQVDLVAALGAQIRAMGASYEVAALDTGYPQGQPRHMLEAITGRELPHPGEPEDLGCAVVGVDTLHAVYEAVVLDRPLLERVVTVTGVVNRPSNLKARIGTSVRELIEECGGFRVPPERVVLGGPMTGLAITDLDLPLTKDVTGIVALSRKDRAAPPRTSCISCGRCVSVCPAGLSPLVLHKQINHGRPADAVLDGLGECSECGLCAYACPAGIPLVEILRHGKALVRGGRG
jgi:electron transport complex protein RnfC